MGLSKRLRSALLGAVTLGVLAFPVGAPAVELAGEWAPVNRCPIDDPLVVNADGSNSVALCVSAKSPGGEIKLGKMDAAATGASDLQFAIVTDAAAEEINAVNGTGGAIQSEPVKVKGGLLGIMCPAPKGDPISDLVPKLCELLVDNPLNRVTAEVQSAGPITDFDLAAGLGVGEPILTLPVKIKLNNPFLGNTCFIGSEEDPILLRPANTNLDDAQAAFVAFAPDGTADPDGDMVAIRIAGAVQGDSTFAVPEADGCGLLNLLSPAINHRVGLPSPSGSNRLVLNDATTNLIGLQFPGLFAPNAGRQLNEWWHGAVIP